LPCVSTLLASIALSDGMSLGVEWKETREWKEKRECGLCMSYDI